MRRLGKIRRLVGNLPREGLELRCPHACKRLVERSRLNDTLVGELLGGRSGNGQARRRTLAARRGRHLPKGVSVVSRRIARLNLNGFALLSGLDYLPLPVPHVYAALQLLTHGRVLGVESGRQACEADVVHGQAGALLAGQRGRRASTQGRGADGHVVGQVESTGTVARGGHVRR